MADFTKGLERRALKGKKNKAADLDGAFQSHITYIMEYLAGLRASLTYLAIFPLQSPISGRMSLMLAHCAGQLHAGLVHVEAEFQTAEFLNDAPELLKMPIFSKRSISVLRKGMQGNSIQNDLTTLRNGLDIAPNKVKFLLNEIVNTGTECIETASNFYNGTLFQSTFTKSRYDQVVATEGFDVVCLSNFKDFAQTLSEKLFEQRNPTAEGNLNDERAATVVAGLMKQKNNDELPLPIKKIEDAFYMLFSFEQLLAKTMNFKNFYSIPSNLYTTFKVTVGNFAPMVTALDDHDVLQIFVNEKLVLPNEVISKYERENSKDALFRRLARVRGIQPANESGAITALAEFELLLYSYYQVNGRLGAAGELV